MKRLTYIFSTTALLALFLTGVSYSQMGMMWGGSGGWGLNGRYCGMYRTGNPVTVSGEVISVDTFVPYAGMGHGVRFVLKSDKETISVHLGPVWYLEKQDFRIEAKDKITVKGVAVTFDGNKIIMASEVKKGDSTIKLWDEKGYPRWSGGGWR